MAHWKDWKLPPEQLVGRVFVLCCLLLICAPSFNLFPWGKLKQVDVAERRALAPYPHPQSWADVPPQCTHFVDDHFGFRDDFIWLRFFFSHLLGDSGSSSVIWGKQGWLFYLGDGTLPDLQHRADFSPEELARYKATILAKAQALEKLHIGYLFIAAPNKSSIYPEYVPGGIINPEGLSRLEAIEQDVASDPVIRPYFLSLRPTLLQAKQNGDLFFKTDSHWNVRGAYCGYRALMEALKSNAVLNSSSPSGPITDSLVIPESNFVPGIYAARDLDRIARYPLPEETELAVSSFHPFPVDFCHPFLSKRWRRHFDEESGFAVPSLSYNSHAVNPQTILLFGDSFSNYLGSYLRENFRRVIYIQTATGLPVDHALLDDLVNRYHPKLVLEEALERLLIHQGARSQSPGSPGAPPAQDNDRELELSPLADGAWHLVNDGKGEALRNVESGATMPIQPPGQGHSLMTHACVDAVTSTSDPTSESITLAGWMVDSATQLPCDGLMVTLGDVPVAFDTPDRSRPDVALFLKNPSSASCGFSTRVTSRAITRPGPVRLFSIRVKPDRTGLVIQEINIPPEAVTTPISILGLKLNKTPTGISLQR